MVEYQFTHHVKDAKGRIYSRTSLLELRAEMMQTRAGHLGRLRKSV